MGADGRATRLSGYFDSSGCLNGNMTCKCTCLSSGAWYGMESENAHVHSVEIWRGLNSPHQLHSSPHVHHKYLDTRLELLEKVHKNQLSDSTIFKHRRICLYKSATFTSRSALGKNDWTRQSTNRMRIGMRSWGDFIDLAG